MLGVLISDTEISSAAVQVALSGNDISHRTVLAVETKTFKIRVTVHQPQASADGRLFFHCCDCDNCKPAHNCGTQSPFYRRVQDGRYISLQTLQREESSIRGS